MVMKTNNKLILIPVISLLLTGCFLKKNSSNSSDTSNPSSSTSYTPEEIEDPTPALIDSDEYKAFWNHGNTINISISMPRNSAEFINNYQYDHDDSTYHDYYVPCTAIIKVNDQTYTFEEAGIRAKGNMSRRHCLTDGHFSLNSLIHYKLTFKETFDDEEYDTIEALKPFKHDWSSDENGRKARKKRRLFDMEKLDIKWNRNDDETLSKQAFALQLFQDSGVLAGHSTLAKTSIGIDGETPITTTYEALECIDDVFISRHFNDAKAAGDLYKCTYTNKGPANFSSSYTVDNQIGVEKNKKGYHPSYDLKTNKKTSNHANLLNLIKVINDKNASASVYKENINKVLNMNEFISYESIAYLCGNFDDMRNNANNYYLYFESATNIAHIIPYDFDRCFGMGSEGRQNYMTSFSPESTKMQCNGDWQSINLYWRTICTSSNSDSGHANVERIEEYRALYQKNIEDLLNNNKVSASTFTSFVNSFPSAYRGNPNGSGNGNTSFSNYLSLKIAAINENCPSYDIH